MPEFFSAVRTIGKADPSWADLRKLIKGFPSEADVQVARAAYQRLHPPPAPAPAPADEETAAAPADEPPATARPAAAAARPEPPAATRGSSRARARETGSGSRACSGGRAATSSVRSAPAAPPPPVRVRASEAIALAMADVAAGEQADASLAAERQAAIEAADTATELRGLLGGDSRIEALRATLLPPPAAAVSADEANSAAEPPSHWAAAATQLLGLRVPARLLERIEGLSRPFSKAPVAR